MATLEIRSGEAEGKSFDIGRSAIIGRHKSNEVPVPDPRVSRKHSKIFFEDGKFFVEDLDSRNGTSVNGVETERQQLYDGDHIEIGDTTIVFQSEEAPASASEEEDESDAAVEEASPSAVSGAGGGSGGAQEEVSETPVSSEPSYQQTGGGGFSNLIVYGLGLLTLLVVFGLSYFATIKVLPMIFG